MTELKFKESLRQFIGNEFPLNMFSVYYDAYDNGAYIGTIGYFKMENKFFSDIFISENNRKKGYSRILYEFIIEKHNLHPLYALIHVDNNYSKIIHEKLGFVNTNFKKLFEKGVFYYFIRN